MKNVYYNLFDKKAKYYVKGIYCSRKEVKRSDLRFSKDRPFDFKVKSLPNNATICCLKCT